MDVIELIQFRNRCLEKIRHLSTTYLHSEVPEKSVDALSLFEKFQFERDACCRALELMDRKITEAAQKLSAHPRSLEKIAQIQTLSAEGDQVIRDILQNDEQIFARVEEIKNLVKKELLDSKKGQKVVGRFRSLWVSTPGGSLDGSA